MKIAIDIVLLPPEEIMDKAIEINKTLTNDPIKLNKENCLPHISLCMGVVDENDLLELKQVLASIEFSLLILTITGTNEEACCFEIQKIKELQELHETIMRKFSSYISYDATKEMFFNPLDVEDSDIDWVNDYKEKSGFNEYYPHITLGITKLDEKELNESFVASRLAICQLGSCCTCRKILFETTLKL